MTAATHAAKRNARRSVGPHDDWSETSHRAIRSPFDEPVEPDDEIWDLALRWHAGGLAMILEVEHSKVEL